MEDLEDCIDNVDKTVAGRDVGSDNVGRSELGDDLHPLGGLDQGQLVTACRLDHCATRCQILQLKYKQFLISGRYLLFTKIKEDRIAIATYLSYCAILQLESTVIYCN